MASSQSSSSERGSLAYARPAAFLVALALMALTAAIVAWRLQPPAARGSDARPDQFSAERARNLLQELLAEGVPHPVGSRNNDRVRDRLVARLQDLGYEVEIQDAVACRSRSGAHTSCAPVENVLARLPGHEDGPAVALMAHYDSVGAAPGAADDLSSVVTILEVARILKADGPFRNPLLFLLTDGEEVGLMGAQAFVEQHPWAEEVGVVVNLEARGTSGQSLMFETSEDNAWIVDAYASAVPRPATSSLFFEIYRTLPNDTDLTVFKNAGLSGLNMAYIETSQHYHTSLDNMDSLNLGSLQHHGDSALAVTRELASVDLSNPPAGNATYMDLLGFGVLRWPEAWTVPLALAAFLLLLVAAVVVIRRGELTVRGLLWGLLAALLTLILPILLGLGLVWLISSLSGGFSPGYAYPLPMRLALGAGTLLCSGLVATLLARRAGLWGLGLGAWLLSALLALILSFALTGAAVILLVPALLASLLFATVALAGGAGSPLAREAVLMTAAFAGSLIWLTIALLFESALGFEMSPAIVLFVALSVAVWLPLFAVPRARARARNWLLAAAAAVMAGAAVVALLVPPFSESRPQRLNLYHYEDQDAGIAYWVSVPHVAQTPDVLRQYLSAEPQAVFPWFDGLFHVDEAPPTGAPAPDLEVLSDEESNGGRRVEVRLRSLREGDRIDLLLPLAGLEAVSVAGETFAVQPADADGDLYRFWCWGRSCDGLTLTLQFNSNGPVEAMVVDYTMGLPPSGEQLLQARPATAAPSQEGDLTLILRRVEF